MGLIESVKCGDGLWSGIWEALAQLLWSLPVRLPWLQCAQSPLPRPPNTKYPFPGEVGCGA
jgi:hypothetical protein